MNLLRLRNPGADLVLTHSIRFIMQMCFGDYTNQIWLSGFNDVGVTLLGKTADEMNRLKEEDEGDFNQIVAQGCGKMYDFSLRAKAETYGDNTRCVCLRSYHSLRAADPPRVLQGQVHYPTAHAGQLGRGVEELARRHRAFRLNVGWILRRTARASEVLLVVARYSIVICNLPFV